MTGLDKIRADLEWRGPGGKPARYVVLDRGLAQEVADEVDRLRDEIVSLAVTVEGQEEQMKIARTEIERLKRPAGEGREICECPHCGRSHWRLGTPPR